MERMRSFLASLENTKCPLADWSFLSCEQMTKLPEKALDEFKCYDFLPSNPTEATQFADETFYNLMM